MSDNLITFPAPVYEPPPSQLRPDIDEIEARLNAASPAPWVAYTGMNGIYITPDIRLGVSILETYQQAQPWRKGLTIAILDQGDESDAAIDQSFHDGVFIGAARQDIPALIAYIRHLEDQLDLTE